jgi:hypothetical protein
VTPLTTRAEPSTSRQLSSSPRIETLLHSDLLASQYPRIDVTPDVLFVDDRDILTSAGSAAGLDACSHILRQDFGTEVASQVETGTPRTTGSRINVCVPHSGCSSQPR